MRRPGIRCLSLTLLDRNVLVDAFDPRDRLKQSRAIAVVEHLVDRGEAVLSVQCLIEFFRVVTGRLPDRLDPATARREAEHLALSCRVLPITPRVALEGLRGVTEYGLSVWDAQIWAAAVGNQVLTVLGEDIPSGRVIEGVRFLNPFADQFDLSDP